MKGMIGQYRRRYKQMKQLELVFCAFHDEIENCMAEMLDERESRKRKPRDKVILSLRTTTPC